MRVDSCKKGLKTGRIGVSSGKGKPIRRTAQAVRVAARSGRTSTGEDETDGSDGESLETSSGTGTDSTSSGETSEDWGVTGDEDVVGEGTDDGWSALGMTTEGVTGA